MGDVYCLVIFNGCNVNMEMNFKLGDIIYVKKDVIDWHKDLTDKLYEYVGTHTDLILLSPHGWKHNEENIPIGVTEESWPDLERRTILIKYNELRTVFNIKGDIEEL